MHSRKRYNAKVKTQPPCGIPFRNTIVRVDYLKKAEYFKIREIQFAEFFVSVRNNHGASFIVIIMAQETLFAKYNNGRTLFNYEYKN